MFLKNLIQILMEDLITLTEMQGPSGYNTYQFGITFIVCGSLQYVWRYMFN